MRSCASNTWQFESHTTNLILKYIMSEQDFTDSITFDHDLQIMEVNFSNLTFDSAKMVDQYYDEIDRQMAELESDQWYFLVNYQNCRIFELAWIRFAQRGKRLNLAHSLGSVRFAVREDVSQSIEASAKSQHFDPNLFASREGALAEIEKMKQSSQAE